MIDVNNNLNKKTKKTHRKGQNFVSYMDKKSIKRDLVNKPSKKSTKETSWGREAVWYDKMLEENDDTYQSKVILPNLIRILNPKPDEIIIDFGCGQGFFSRIIAKSGAKIIGIDVGKELIKIANDRAQKEGLSSKSISFYTASAEDAHVLASRSADKIFIILALQNMKDISKVISEIKRVLKPGGSVIVVLNHPMFRVIKNSDWGFDESLGLQYRKVYKYLSQFEASILMHPGDANSKSFTKSFHRSLQDYVKAFSKEGLFIVRLEEWISHKTSQNGPRKLSEDLSRKEIPLFMCLELKSI